MKNNRNLRVIAVCAALFVLGLVLGKGRGDEDPLVNHTSAMLLTVGFLGIVVFAAVEVAGRLRHRGEPRRRKSLTISAAWASVN